MFSLAAKDEKCAEPHAAGYRHKIIKQLEIKEE